MLTRKAKTIAAAAMVLVGICLGLCIVELFLRIHPPEWLNLRMNDLNLRENGQEFGSDAGWSVERVDGKFVQFTPNTQFHVASDEYQNDAHIDEWGGRVVAGNTKSQKLVVPFLGDSFMFGIGVRDEGTFVSLLHSSTNLRFLNLGVPGSALPNHLDILEMRYRELGSPKTAIFSFFTGNDYVDIVKYYTEGRANAHDAHQGDPWALRTLQAAIVRYHFLGRSYLVEYCKQILLNRAHTQNANLPRQKTWLIRLPNGGHIIKESLVLMQKSQSARRSAEKYLEIALERLRQFSQEKGLTPFVLVIPDKIQVDPDLLKEKLDGTGLDSSDFDPRLPDQIVTEELTQYGIQHYDLFDCLNGKKGQYYQFDDHFTPQGAKTASKCISVHLNSFLAMHN